MKKRFLILLLAVMAVVCIALSACITDHVHNFGKDWKADGENHWHECSCGEKSSVGKHEFANWVVDVEATETQSGSKHADCNVCGYRLTVEIPPVSSQHTHQYLSNWFSNEQRHWHECSCGARADEGAHVQSDWIVDVPATTSQEGQKHTECTVCGRVLQTQTIEKLTSATRTVDFYAINDFHGEVDKISTVAGFLTQAKNQNSNTVLINSGDMFQGSLQSNYNYGKLLTDCMDDVGFDCLTLGNHEFDWGLEKLSQLMQSSDTAFLGANIYHWDAATKTWGTFASEIAQPYVVKTLDNGLKVGIIGVIGDRQITSISSQLVQTIGFKNPAEVIPSLAEQLRNEENCDVVVVSAHTDADSLLEIDGFDITEYADAVFCAHTHHREDSEVNGVPFIQGGSYGNYVSHIQLSVDEKGNVDSQKVENISYDYTWPNKLTVEQLVDNSNSLVEEEANRVLATFDGSLDSQTAVPRLASHAIAVYAEETYGAIDLAMVNSGRSGISYAVTYSDLYQALPFDNQVYIAKVKGSDILYESNYNEIWRVSGRAIQYNEYYTVALIDYLLFHQNANRDYDYFPSAFTSGFDPVPLTKEGEDIYNYRLITRDFLLENDNLSLADYVVTNNRTDVNLLTSEVQFSDDGTTDIVHQGTADDPYTVSEAILAAQGKTSATAVSAYVSATVEDVSNAILGSASGDLGNIYLTDGTNTLYVYYISKFDGATKTDNWSSAQQLKSGDTVLIHVRLYTYGGRAQVGSGYCVTINGVDAQLYGSPTANVTCNFAYIFA